MTQPKPVENAERAFSAADHEAFESAYHYFNKMLFGDKLPMCFITIQRKQGARGYFWNDKFQTRDGSLGAHELAMNPDTFSDRSDKDILSTFVHEMVHCWQEAFGSPSRSGYHNKEWAQKMREVGLKPVSVSNPGKETGQKCTHEIIEGGAFDFVATKLIDGGWVLGWESYKEPSTSSATNAKTKYTCGCNNNIWGKPGLTVTCDSCQMPFTEQQ
jgi:SprT-like family